MLSARATPLWVYRSVGTVRYWLTLSLSTHICSDRNARQRALRLGVESAMTFRNFFPKKTTERVSSTECLFSITAPSHDFFEREL